MKKAKFFGYTISIVLFASSVWLYSSRQEVLDWYRLRDYEPTGAISLVASNASLNDLGKKLFYVHDPELLDKTEFAGKCSSGEETIVLGCYITHTKIYVFDVNDVRLEGVEEVTAAHEVLHAAYDRLSDKYKLELDKHLRSTFVELNSDRLNSTIASYEERDPTVVPNELHSILGTEVRVLTPFLEDHYAQYFVDRSAVVKIAEAYESEFTKREEQIVSYDEQLKQLDIDIKQSEINIEFLGNALQTENNKLTSLKSDPAAYNAAIPAYNASVREYNQLIASLKTKINSYNQLVEDRNAIAVEEQELVEAIDTRAVEL